MSRLSLSLDLENGPERGLKTVSFNPYCNLIKQCRIWSDAALLFASVPNVPVQISQVTLKPQHSHVTATRIARLKNNRYLDFVERTVWLHWSKIITWTTTLRIYYGSIVNKWAKTDREMWQKWTAPWEQVSLGHQYVLNGVFAVLLENQWIMQCLSMYMGSPYRNMRFRWLVWISSVGLCRKGIFCLLVLLLIYLLILVPKVGEKGISLILVKTNQIYNT